MSQRREFLKDVGLFALIVACNPGAFFGPSKRIPKTFFGYMAPGITLNTPDSVDIPFGTYRDWNNGASYEWVYKNNWEGFETAIRFARLKNVDLIHVLAGEAETPLPPIALWRSYVSEAVARSQGRVQFWEIWNEPVYARALPQQMAEYTSEAYSIIKASSPDSVVLTPSFNELLTDYGYSFAQDYFNERANADVAAFHSYDGMALIPDVIRRIRGLTDLPLWNTETVGVLSLEPQAVAGVERVVLNGQIELLGQSYRDEYLRLVA